MIKPSIKKPNCKTLLIILLLLKINLLTKFLRFLNKKNMKLATLLEEFIQIL